MKCTGFGQNGCIYPTSNDSPWGLCVSCTKIVNRHFLIETMRYIENNGTTGNITVLGTIIDVQDFRRLFSIFERIQLTPGFKDPRITFLCMVEAKKPENFNEVARAFLSQSGFVTSLTLYYKQHLPQKIHDALTCRTLAKIFRVGGLDPQSFPVCPHCFARVADTFYKRNNRRSAEIPGKVLELLRFYTSGSQAVLWREGIKKILDVFWENKKMNLLNWTDMGEALQRAIPNQEEFSRLIRELLRNHSCLESIVEQTMDPNQKLFFEIWSGETLNFAFVKKALKERVELYKEDLMIKTWHPKRLLTWCFDLEELSDFGPIDPNFDYDFLEV